MTIYPNYSMSAEVLTSLAALPVGIQGARLLHGLYHIVGLGLTDPRLWHTNAMRQQSIRVAVLRKTIGPAGARDNRHIHAAIAELGGTGLFKRLDVSSDGCGLTFQFSRTLIDRTIARNAPFAMFNVHDIATCRSLQSLRFFERDTLHHNKDMPMFTLPGIDPDVVGKRWPELRDKWLRAAMKTAQLTGHRYLFGVGSDPVEIGTQRVTVKITHDKTAWQPGHLYRFAHPASLIEVDASGHRHLGGAEARAKWAHVRVPDPTGRAATPQDVPPE